MPVSVTTGGHGNINISEILGDHCECNAIWNAANISINSKHLCQFSNYNICTCGNQKPGFSFLLDS